MKSRVLTIFVAYLIGFLLAATLSADEPAAPPQPSATESELQDLQRELKGIPEEIASELKKGKTRRHEMYEKLTPEQIFELEKIRLNQPPPDVPGTAPIIVAIVFGMPVAIVAVVLWFRHRRNRQLHDTLARMIEKGVPIPPELLTPPERRKPSDLRRGVVLIAAGLGVIGFFLAQGEDAWGLGLIPLLIGAGYLVVWKLDQRKQVA
jgi:hypothetical protein